jgi:DNA-binding PadR family transcriptional regulator
MTNRGAGPVGDVTRTVLLAALSRQAMHGYEIRTTLAAWHMEFWADIKVGSIHAGLKRLAAEGLVEDLGVTRAGNRPPRRTYGITDEGREELHRLLRAAWSPSMRTARPVDVALSFVWSLPADELVALLEERLQALTNQRLLVDPAFLPQDGEPGAAAMIDDLFEHERRLLDAERAWTEHVLTRFRAGAYAMGATPARRGRSGRKAP